MKYISMELTNQTLSYMVCDTQKSIENNSVVVPIPADLGTNILTPPGLIAEFIAAQLKKSGLKKLPVFLMLDLEQVISVAFSHMPAKPDKLRGLALLYAQSSLPKTGGEYYVSFSPREYLHADGQNRSILYGASSGLIKQFYNALKKEGVEVYSIEPSGAAFSRAVQHFAANRSNEGQTADIYIDFGRTSSLVTVCRNDQIVFEQSFSSIYNDVIDTYVEVTEGTKSDAENFFIREGLDPRAEVYTRYPDLLRRMNILVDVTLDEIIRTLRIVFAGERLETGSLFISGSFVEMPGFVERLQYDSVGFVAEDNIQIIKNARLSGGVPPKTATTENLLHTYFQRQKRSTQSAIVGIALILLIAMIFPIQFLVYRSAKNELESLQSQISDSRYNEVKSLLNEKSRLEGLKSNLESALKKVPDDQQSKAREILQTLYKQMSPYVSSLSVNLNNTTGELSVQFTAHSYNSFISMKKDIEKAGYFSINPTFSCSVNASTGSCTGTVNMNVNNFVPFKVAQPQTAQTTSREVAY